LLSGNHEKIRQFRRYNAIEKTYKKRPDLLEEVSLSKEDEKILKEIKNKE